MAYVLRHRESLPLRETIPRPSIKGMGRLARKLLRPPVAVLALLGATSAGVAQYEDVKQTNAFHAAVQAEQLGSCSLNGFQLSDGGVINLSVRNQAAFFAEADLQTYSSTLHSRRVRVIPPAVGQPAALVYVDGAPRYNLMATGESLQYSGDQASDNGAGSAPGPVGNIMGFSFTVGEAGLDAHSWVPHKINLAVNNGTVMEETTSVITGHASTHTYQDPTLCSGSVQLDAQGLHFMKP